MKMSGPELDKDFTVLVKRVDNGPGSWKPQLEVFIYAKAWRTDGALSEEDVEFPLACLGQRKQSIILSWDERHSKTGMVHSYSPDLRLPDPRKKRISGPSKAGMDVYHLICWLIRPRESRWRSYSRTGDLVIERIYGQVAALDVIDV